MERLFSDHQLAGIRFLEIGSDIWAQFKLLEKDLSYTVNSLKDQNGIKIDFRPVFHIQPLSDPPEDAIYNLEEVKFDADGITSRDWETYPILTFAQAPRVEVIILDRPGEPALGAGEASSEPVAAAIANALFDATQVRVRRLPLSPDNLRQAASA